MMILPRVRETGVGDNSGEPALRDPGKRLRETKDQGSQLKFLEASGIW